MSASTGDEGGPAVPTKRGRPRRQYRCVHCARTFKRSEHCVRHERTHTHEKPFACRYCNKTYSRKDLVTRHERTLHPKASQVIEETDINVTCSPSPMQPTYAVTLETLPSDDHGDSQPIDEDDVSGDYAPFADVHRLDENELADIIMDIESELVPQPLTGTTVQDPDQTRSQGSHLAVDGGPWMSCPSPSPIAHGAKRRSRDKEREPRHVDHSMILFQDTIYSEADDGFGRGSHTTRGSRRLSYQDEHQDQNKGTASSRHRQPQQQRGATSLFSTTVPPEVDFSSFAFTPSPTEALSFDPDLLGKMGPHFDFQNPMSIAIPSLLLHPSNQYSQMGMASQTNSSSSETASSSVGSSRSSQATTTDMPILLRDGRRSFPTLPVCDQAYSSIKADLARRVGSERAEKEMPPASQCDEFLSSYVSNFHSHLPIIHLSTFSPGRQPSPLTLIMCSIGALYRLHRRRARRLYHVARDALEAVGVLPDEEKPSLVKDHPLRLVQARMLLDFFAIMSGDVEIMSLVIQNNGFYTVVYHKARAGLQDRRGEPSKLSWQSWAYFESWKRLMGAMLICSTLSMVMYDVNPGMNATMDLEFEAFHDDKLWSAQSPAEWRNVLDHIDTPDKPQSQRSMKDILVDIVLPGKPSTCIGAYKVSAYSALVLMHAMVIHMWQRAQVTHAFVGDALGSTGEQEAMTRLLLGSGLQTLSRCQSFLDNAQYDVRAEKPGVNALNDDVDEVKEASLVFDCNAILRTAHTRLFKNGSLRSSVDLASFQDGSSNASIVSFIDSKMERGAQIFLVVAKAFEGLRDPVRMGHLLVRKTAAFRWSVKQAVASWDCALLVSKWVHTIEMDRLGGKQTTSDEEELLEKIKDILEEAECDVEINSSLAAAVARTWSLLLQDVWIWGITPLMGAALDQVADGYTRALNVRISLYES